MDKKESIEVDVLAKGTQDEANGMRGLMEQNSSLEELKKLIDLLLDCKDLEITGAIKGYLVVQGATPNTAVQPNTVH